MVARRVVVPRGERPHTVGGYELDRVCRVARRLVVRAAPALAALLVGLAGLMLAGLILLATRMAQRSGRTARRRGNNGSTNPGLTDNLNDLAARLGSLAAQQASAQAQAHPYRSFAVALIAGLAVGGIPELRAMIEKMLKN